MNPVGCRNVIKCPFKPLVLPLRMHLVYQVQSVPFVLTYFHCLYLSLLLPSIWPLVHVSPIIHFLILQFFLTLLLFCAFFGIAIVFGFGFLLAGIMMQMGTFLVIIFARRILAEVHFEVPFLDALEVFWSTALDYLN